MLAPARSPAYDVSALATAGAGVDSPKHVRRASANRQALFSCLSSSHGGLRGEPEEAAGVLTGRSVNPALIRHPLFDSRVGGLHPQLGVPAHAHR